MGPLKKRYAILLLNQDHVVFYLYIEERWNIHTWVLPRCSLRCLLPHAGTNPHYKSDGLWLQIVSLHMGALKTMQMDRKIPHWAPDCVHAACKCMKHEAGRTWFLTWYRRAADRNPRHAAGICAYFLYRIYYWCWLAVSTLTGKRAEAAHKKHQPAWYKTA